MKFWKDNKIDGEFDMPVQSVAELFVEAVFSDPMLKLKFDNWPYERTLRGWLTDPAGPIAPVWDEDEFDELYDAVVLQVQLHREAIDPAPQLTRPGGVG